MSEVRKNYYGSFCTEMYEILHERAPEDELNFYLSYAEKGKKILEPLCGSGRFLIPFIERGFDITGIDMSNEMLQKLKLKFPDAKTVHTDIMKYDPKEKFDYIFISSGSVSLFTDIDICKQILIRIKKWLLKTGKFVFAVDTIKNRCIDDNDYNIAVSVKTKEIVFDPLCGHMPKRRCKDRPFPVGLHLCVSRQDIEMIVDPLLPTKYLKHVLHRLFHSLCLPSPIYYIFILPGRTENLSQSGRIKQKNNPVPH